MNPVAFCVLLLLFALQLSCFPLQVKGLLQSRLHELEPLPELLKSTELRLHEAQERLASNEQKASENALLIGQLTSKVTECSLVIFLIKPQKLFYSLYSVVSE